MQLFNEDCISGMERLPDNCVDMILTDLPYSLTACHWDKSIDLSAMWQRFRRILKPCCSAVLFASGKFTYELINSNFEQFKYKWIWVKNAPTMFVHAKNAPMRKFEEIVVFSDGSINHPTCTTRRMKYNPQGVVPCIAVRNEPNADKPSQIGGGKFRPANSFLANGELKRSQLRSPMVCKNTNRADSFIGDRPSRACGTTYEQTQTGYHSDVLHFGDVRTHGALKRFGGTYRKAPSHVDYYVQEQTNYPADVLYYDTPHNVTKFHPTQKPTDLLEYLIRTYTDEGETVLDATMGSGSTGVACVNTDRNFIGFELDEKFFNIAQERIRKATNERLQRLF